MNDTPNDTEYESWGAQRTALQRRQNRDRACPSPAKIWREVICPED